MNYEALKELISSSVALGEVKARAALIQGSGIVRRKQVLEYLATEGYKASDLDHWEKRGVITVTRGGERVATTYNIEEVMEVILMLKAKRFIF